MGLIEIIILAIGLAMDAFAVAICKGLSVKKLEVKHAVIVGLYFGGFQGLMPLIGYFLGTTFADKITKFSHWVAFGLLLLIGANMIKEALEKDEEECGACFSFKTMFPMAIATSIDALAVGVALSLETDGINIFSSVAIIGIITFIISAIGVKIGNVFGNKYKSKAEFIGGCILILLGVKILLEGLGILVL